MTIIWSLRALKFLELVGKTDLFSELKELYAINEEATYIRQPSEILLYPHTAHGTLQ